MKTRILLTTIAAATFFLTACSTNNEPGEDWDGRLHLSSNLATLTRASHGLDEKIAAGQTVWLYVDGKETDGVATQYYGKKLTTAADNAFSDAGDMFFPANEESISLYAFHINESGTVQMSVDAYPINALTHQIASNQQSSSGNSGYARSDLLYAKTSLSRDDARTKGGAVALPFKHLLSKIEVVLLKGTGMDAMTIQKVEILNTKLSATVTPSKANETLTVSPGGDVDGSSHNPIQIDNGVTADKDNPVLNEAIIIPQQITEGTDFIRVTLSTGGVLTYKLDDNDGSTSSVTFAPGTRYRYTITAKLTGLTVTASITPWTGGDTPTSGDAVMQ